MTDIEKRASVLLIVGSAIALVVSIVTGALNHTAVAIGAAGGVIVVALFLLVYFLWIWPKKR